MKQLRVTLLYRVIFTLATVQTAEMVGNGEETKYKFPQLKFSLLPIYIFQSWNMISGFVSKSMGNI